MGVVSLLPPAMETESKCTDDPVAGVDGMSFGMDDPNKKIRKPYTITKSRQNWTEIEHDKFLEALHLFDRDWKKIEAFVGTKTAIQIRSHAQKYFLKLQKSGANEHVPPPRPKRKAAHPYPHKAPKNAVPKVGVLRSCVELIEPVDSYSWPAKPTDNAAFWGGAASHNCCSSSSIESGPGVWAAGESNSRRTAEQDPAERVLPDFAKVYRFIGSVFDPCESNHLQKLKMMDPVDVDTAVLLMRNLCANLKSPQFEGYRRLFSWHDAEAGAGGGTATFSPVGGLRAMPANDAITSS